ncbi:anti-anti-sigma factor [Intrasporangium oryzae NRRL B-24470]|uniref:Anti-sigma factor antagonist n=1 Tax=Intrasporangium oryzae NRRL B-24470 TaxID=1386089 RepID=W9G7M1_9MICO|nr:STAS domain-containing protein [Intrasporangium oryzae]EWT02000.1 anti-anti-sigma factor [Intrasporangium oryzae NRRL B-24470]
MSDLARIEASDHGAARLVRVSGEIDLSNAREVMEAIAGAVPDEVAVVFLDLSDTTYLDSTGIAMIFRLAERLGHRRQDLRLVVPTDGPVRAVLDLTNVQLVAPIEETVPDTPDQA